MCGTARLLLALAVGGAICAAAAGRQLSAASATTSAAAAASPGACIANPDHPFEAERPELGACKACNAPANTTCVECWPLFSLSDAGECVMCNTSYCLECRPDEPEFCLTCGDYWGEAETGFYATEDGECLPCPVDNCMQCQNFNGTCTGCSAYMGVIKGECEACSDSEHCLSCNGDVDVCQECGPGTFLQGGKCKTCPDNCFKCSSEEACDECESQGYFLDSSTRLCGKCPDGCLSCGAAGTCDQCDTGSGWTNMTAGPPCARCTDRHCTTCTPDAPGNCTICASTASDPWFGGPNAQGACVRCAMDNCQACQTDHKICDWCTDGYFNDAQLGECTPCEDRWPHCTSCGLDATRSQPGIPACFGCAPGWQNDESRPDKPCVRAPPSPAPA